VKVIQVKVIPNAKKAEVIEEKDFYKVKVNAPAIEGKANKAVIKSLADYFKVKPKQISIIKGEKNSLKTIAILL
jgi:uncharacterized protein (TIGR00251 family)